MDRLINQIRNGATVEQRTQTLIEGLRNGYDGAQGGGPDAYAQWSSAVQHATPALCNAVAGIGGGQAAGVGQAVG